MGGNSPRTQPGTEPRTLTILLVEDDVRVATLTAEWLRRTDFEVIVSSNGKQASEMACARTEPIDLLLADVMLPGMRGPVLAGAIRHCHPEMAVLFTSGYSPELLGEMFSSTMESALLLYKPYTAEQLVSRVHLALARKAGEPEPMGDEGG